jgi:hypothetical protein
MLSFDPLPPAPLTGHQLQPTATAAVTTAVAAANYVIHHYRSRCKEDNIIAAIAFACGVLIVIINHSPASTTMGPRSSFSRRNGG